MFINILLPYKEKFSINKASSVSLTVANNLEFSKYKKQIRIFGHNVEKIQCIKIILLALIIHGIF